MAKTTLIARAYRWFVGAFGNLSISPTLVAKLAAVPSGDVVAFGDKVEPNLKVVGCDPVSTALGRVPPSPPKSATPPSSTPKARWGGGKVFSRSDDLMTELPTRSSPSPSAAALRRAPSKLKLHYEVVGNL